MTLAEGKINGLDLFSGIGGLTLALAPWVRPIAYCERDIYAQCVLLSRMHSGELPSAPIWDDVCSLRGTDIPLTIDIIYGGFPCQDISTAGNGAGLAGERSGLFFEIVRLAEEIKPKFIFLENVAAIRTRGLDRVAKELANIGYDCRWSALSAYDVGAPHKRERWWLLAYSDSDGARRQKPRNLVGASREDESKEIQRERVRYTTQHCSQTLANADGAGLERRCGEESEFNRFTAGGGWESEPNVGRVVNGLPHRVDRIKGLGNAVVPKQAQEAFARLIGLTK